MTDTTKKSISEYSERRVDPASISWHNIEVLSKPKTSLFCLSTGPPPHKIIKNVSGLVKPGQTLAIMGSSGAGKTTLLNVLTARNLSMFHVNGVVKINGKQADVQTITEMTAYVQQEDLFIPIMTVREHLIFQAMLRMDNKIPVKVRATRIQSVMEELSLLKCADTQVGGSGSFKGISGGEMKRLAFAVEILSNPSIMFCDEPTSGLDAFMAHNLVSMIRRMARQKGRTIICTIHQPSSDVFSLFDSLLLLADGRVAYMGELSLATGYFNNLGYRCPSKYNPADFYVKELAIVPGKEFECRNKINHICDYYLSTHPDRERFKYSSFLETEPKTRYKAGIGQEFKALSWRCSLVTQRQPLLSYVRLIQTAVISVILGLVYYQQAYNQYGVGNMTAALFLLITQMSYQNAFAVINTFKSELPVFMREHSNGMYRVTPYFICKNLAEFKTFVIIPISFVAIYYYMVGFTHQSLVNVMFTTSVGILTSCIAVGFGYFMSSACSSTELAVAITPPLLFPFQLFGGFFLNPKNIPNYLQWVRTLSWYRYGFELLMYNQWKSVSSINCTTEKSSLSVAEQDLQSEPANSMCFSDGKKVMAFYGIPDNIVFSHFGILFAYFIFFRICAFIALLIRSRGR